MGSGLPRFERTRHERRAVHPGPAFDSGCDLKLMPMQALTYNLSNSLPAARDPWSPEAARNRLSSTLFLAALFHGILILGVTFTADSPRRDPPATTLDVVIVTREYENLAPPRNPALLA